MGKGAAAAAENVKVLVRCRPLSEKEKANGHKSCVELDMAAQTVAVRSLVGEPDRFTFDAVINNTFAQKDVFTQFILPLVDSVLEGFNATVFAYGQSGSGKTHTMTGVMGDEELEGVIPRCFKYIFDTVRATRESAPNRSYSMYVSFVELYNGKVRDLLAKQQVTLDVRQSKDQSFFVQGAHVPQVKFPEEIIRHMEEGTERRRTAATELNADSSRSHSLFTLIIECTETLEDGTATSVTSKLNLVDLAGSERQGKTGASGETLKEGCNINLSLSALGTVIDCIVKGAPHVPFRSSPLTMLLKDSLGGNSKTVMFANINPSERNLSETVSTLRFADRAKQIKNKPVVNMDSKDQKIAELTQMLNELREKLKKYENEGTEGLERELESLRERVGELEVSLDNAVNGREADLADFQNEKSRLDTERAAALARQAELEEQLSQVRSDLQIAEACVGDERTQRTELAQLCASYLSPAGAEAGTTPSVGELAKLLRERLGSDSAGAGGASAQELADLQTQVQTLLAENKSLKKSLRATEKEMAEKLREGKDAVKKAESKAKKLSKELAEATATAAVATGAPNVPAAEAQTAALLAAVAEVSAQVADSPLLRSIDAALASLTQRHEELAGGVQRELAAAKTQLARPADGAADAVQQFSAMICEDVHQAEGRGKVIAALLQALQSVRQAWRQSLAAPMAVARGNLEAAREAVAAAEAVDTQAAEAQALVASKLTADVAKAYHQRNALVQLIAAAHPDMAAVDVKKEVRLVLDENESLRRQCEVLSTERDAMSVKVRDSQRYAAMRAELSAGPASGEGGAAASTGTTVTQLPALAAFDGLRAELDEAKGRYEAMLAARDGLYEDLKAQRDETAAAERTAAELQGRLTEAEARLASARGEAEEVARLEARLSERADQLAQLRGLLEKQKTLIVKSNEKAEYLQEKLREVQQDAAAQEAAFRDALEERDASAQRYINERVNAYVESRKEEVTAGQHVAKKLKKKIKRLEEAMRLLEIEFDQKVCECEDLRNALGDQKVAHLRLMRQLDERAGLVGGMNASSPLGQGADYAAVMSSDDPRDVYQNALERARGERKRKADLFDLGEVESVRPRLRSRGSNLTDDDASSGYYSSAGRLT